MKAAGCVRLLPEPEEPLDAVGRFELALDVREQHVRVLLVVGEETHGGVRAEGDARRERDRLDVERAAGFINSISCSFDEV